METETRLRQKATQLDELLRQLTDKLTADQQTQNKQGTDPWHGKSPGPEAMQAKTGPQSKQTFITTRMGAPRRGLERTTTGYYSGVDRHSI